MPFSYTPDVRSQCTGRVSKNLSFLNLQLQNVHHFARAPHHALICDNNANLLVSLTTTGSRQARAFELDRLTNSDISLYWRFRGAAW